MDRPVIFLSAVSAEFRELRQLLHDSFKTHFHVITQDDTLHQFPGGDVRQLLSDAIDGSHAVLHLAGAGFGSTAADPFPEMPGFLCSWTQYEYYYAHSFDADPVHMKQIFAIVCGPTLRSPTFTEKDDATLTAAQKAPLQEAHCQRIFSGKFDATPLASLPRTVNHGQPINDNAAALRAAIDICAQLATRQPAFQSACALVQVSLQERLITLQQHLRRQLGETMLLPRKPRVQISYESQNEFSRDVNNEHPLPSSPTNPEAADTTKDHGVTTSTPDEDVRFTVYRPQQMLPSQWATWLAFAYRDPDDITSSSSEKEVHSIAGAVLGSAADNYFPEKQASSAPLPRESTITIVPQVRGLRFSPQSRSFEWRDAVHHEQFMAIASADSVGSILRGRVTFFVGALILAEINVRVQVTQSITAISQFKTDTRDHARPYRNIFASYSRKDSNIVEHLEKLVTVYGDRYLRDIQYLRSGEDWNAGLEIMIAQADIFQVFWSNTSMHSRYVRREWEYALSLKRANFIRPTYWESPFPKDEALGLPPETLKRLHFQRLPISSFTSSECGESVDHGSKASEFTPNEKVSRIHQNRSIFSSLSKIFAVFSITIFLAAGIIYFTSEPRKTLGLPTITARPPLEYGYPNAATNFERELAELQVELVLAEKNYIHNPNSNEAAQSLSLVSKKIGDFYVSQSRPDYAANALMHYRRSLDVLEKIYANNPESGQAARDVSTGVEILVNYLKTHGQHVEAEKILAYFNPKLEPQDAIDTTAPDFPKKIRPENLTLKEVVSDC